MKIIFFVLLMFPNIIFSKPFISDSTILFKPRWEKGEQKIVKSIYKITQYSEYDTSTIKIDNNYKISITEISKDGYILNIEILKTEFNSFPEHPEYDELLQEYNRLSKGIIFKLKFDNKGIYETFKLDRIRDYFYSITDSIIVKIKNREMSYDSSVDDNIINEVKLDYSSKEKLTDKLLKTILPFFNLYSLEIKTNTVEKRYISILDGIDSVYILNGNEYSESQDDIRLKTYFSPDSSQIRKLNDLITKKNIDDYTAQILSTIINFVEENDFIIDRKNNWIKYQKSSYLLKGANITQEYLCTVKCLTVGSRRQRFRSRQFYLIRAVCFGKHYSAKKKLFNSFCSKLLPLVSFTHMIYSAKRTVCCLIFDCI